LPIVDCRLGYGRRKGLQSVWPAVDRQSAVAGMRGLALVGALQYTLEPAGCAVDHRQSAIGNPQCLRIS